MHIDYGARIRAVCDYLETVHGDKYEYCYSPCIDRVRSVLPVGCVLLHGFVGGVIPESELRRNGFDCEIVAAQWLGFQTFKHFSPLANPGTIAPRGEDGKQMAIKNMRAYADKHYPITKQQRDFIPTSVLDIFETEQIAA